MTSNLLILNTYYTNLSCNPQKSHDLKKSSMVVQCCIRYEFFIEMYTDATSHPGFFCKFTLVYAVFRLDINTHLNFFVLFSYLKCVCIKIHLNISYLIRFLVSHLSFKSISLFSFFGWILVSGSFYQPKIIYNDENDLLKKT